MEIHPLNFLYSDNPFSKGITGSLTLNPVEVVVQFHTAIKEA